MKAGSGSVICETKYPCGTDRQHADRIINRGRCAVCDVLAGTKSTPMTRKLAVMHVDLQHLGSVLRFKGRAGSAVLNDIDRAVVLVRDIIKGLQAEEG